MMQEKPSKKVMPFYEVHDQDLDLVSESFLQSMKHLAAIMKDPKKLMDFCFEIAWHDYTANKVILENLGHEGINARIKFRTNHNARHMAKSHCTKIVAEQQEKPRILSQAGTPLINS